MLQTASAQVLVAGTTVVTAVVLARLLGPHDRGVLAVVLFWPTLLCNLLMFSLNEAVVYAQSRSRLKRSAFRGSGLIMMGGLVVLTLPVGYLILPLVVSANAADQVSTMQMLLLGMLPVHFLATVLLAFDLADKNFSRYNLLRLIPTTSYLLGILSLAATGLLRVETAVAAFFAGLCFALALRWFSQRPQVSWPDSSSDIVRLAKSSWSFHPASVLNSLGSQLDRLIAVSLLGATQVAFYFVVLSLVSAGFGVVSSALNTVMFPDIAGRSGTDAQQSLQSALRRSVVLVALLVVPIAVVSYFAVPVLFGEEFREAAKLAPVLAVAAASLSLRQIAVRCARGLGEGRVGTGAEVVSILAFVVLAIPVWRQPDMVGLSVAAAGANAVSLAFLAWLLARKLSISPASWLLPNSHTGHDLAAVWEMLLGRLRSNHIPNEKTR